MNINRIGYTPVFRGKLMTNGQKFEREMNKISSDRFLEPKFRKSINNLQKEIEEITPDNEEYELEIEFTENPDYGKRKFIPSISEYYIVLRNIKKDSLYLSGGDIGRFGIGAGGIKNSFREISDMATIDYQSF